MSKVEISINPLAEFLEASESRKKKIIAEQLDPDPVRVPYYQRARGSVKRFILNNLDDKILVEDILKIESRPNIKKWHPSDKVNSKEALLKLKEMQFPEVFSSLTIVERKTKQKFFPLNGVNIKISPNLIYSVEIDGQIYLGAVKIHIAKGKKFNNKQSALVAQLLNQFLSNFVVEENEIVDPRLCLCIDPFSGTVISAANKIKYDMRQVKSACYEIIQIWDEKNASQVA